MSGRCNHTTTKEKNMITTKSTDELAAVMSRYAPPTAKTTTTNPQQNPALKTPPIKAIHVTAVRPQQHNISLKYHENHLSLDAKAVVEKIRVLRKYTRETGFKTTRSQNDLLQTLDGNDLANALLVLNEE
jgi:hypothetical protein